MIPDRARGDGSVERPSSRPWRFGSYHADERAREVRAILRPWLRAEPRVILDVGGGDGAVGLGLGWSDAQVVCIDLDIARLRAGYEEARRRRLRAGHVSADATALPIRSGSSQLVLLYGILELVPRPMGLVREAARVLSDGGLAYLVVPNPFSPITLIDDPHTHLPFTHLLPGKLARWYAQRVMHRGVKELGEHFALPSYGSLRRMFASAGLEIHLATNLVRVEDPDLVISPAKRRLAHQLRRLGLLRAARTPLGRLVIHAYDRWLARSWSFVITRAG